MNYNNSKFLFIINQFLFDNKYLLSYKNNYYINIRILKLINLPILRKVYWVLIKFFGIIQL